MADRPIRRKGARPLLREGIGVERDGGGRPVRLALPPRAGARQDPVDVAFLAAFRDGEAMATAAASLFERRPVRRTIALIVGALRLHWEPYCRARSMLDRAPEDISREDLLDFAAWLRRPETPTTTSTYRASVLTAVQRVLAATGRLGPTVEVRRLFRGLHHEVRPRPTPDTDAAKAVVRHAASRTRRLMAMRAAALSEGEPVDVAPADVPTVLAARALRSPAADGPLPADRLRSLRRRSGSRAAEWLEGYSLLYPTIEAVVPVWLLLSVYFRLDAQTSRDAAGLDVRRGCGLGSGFSIETGDEALGTPRVNLTVWKNRARGYRTSSYPVDDDPVGAASLVRFLADWTDAARRHATGLDRHRAFLVVAERSPDAVGALDPDALKTALARFSADAGAGRMTSSQVKRIAIDLVDALTNGDPALRAAAGNHSEAVSRRHYRGEAAEARNAEHLAEQMELRERRLATRGRTDPRDGLAGEEPTSATPGWGCLNPRSSPMPGMRPGALCDAYGRCPACPKVRVDYDSPGAFARAGALLAQLLEDQHRMSAAEWHGVWRPVADAIAERHLPRFTQAARDGRASVPPMMSVIW